MTQHTSGILLAVIMLLVIGMHPVAADQLTLTPDRIDSYLIYVGLGEPQKTEYNFVANRDLTECEIPNATCVIDGHTVSVEILVTDDSESFQSTLRVKDVTGAVATSEMIIRIKDVGAALDIQPIGVSSCNGTSIFFKCEESQITGVRWWFIGFIGVLFVIAVAQSVLRD